MNLGLGDVPSLVKSIADSVYNGEEMGTRGYMRDRYLHNSLVLTGCDLMYRVQGRFLSFGDNAFMKEKFLQLMQ